MDVLEAVRKEIERERLLEPGATVVVGVSGGSDSLCLLHVLNRLRAGYHWTLHVAHLNHCLRATDADEDMVFVALLAMDWGLPCRIEAVDVRAIARRQRLSLEETARQVRYGFLADVGRRVDASAVAVGHHADDQSETVLMHVLRGTGLAGLRGMLPSVDLESMRTIEDRPRSSSPTSRIRLVRPLLSVPRADIEGYCRAFSLQPRFDRSNLDTTHFRNRLRHHLLPLLETYNPNIRALLRRTAEIAAADHELVTEICDAAWEREIKEQSENAILFDLGGWRALPLAVQRATLRRAAYQLRPGLRDVNFLHIEGAVEIATNGSTGAQAILPHGLCLTVDYQTLRLDVAEHGPQVPDRLLLWHAEPVPVALPGRTALRERGHQPPAPHEPSAQTEALSNSWLEADIWRGERDAIFSNTDRWTAYLDADQLGAHLELRQRRAGDRFQPLGMQGQDVALGDFMINAKIPRRWREYIPLLVHDRPDGTQQIAWVVGWRIDDRVKITPETGRIVRFRWLRSRDQG